MRRTTNSVAMAEAMTPGVQDESLPEEIDARGLRRRALTVMVALAVAGLVVAFAPGLGEVRSELAGIDPVWFAIAIGFEVLSSASYVLMFRPVFCPLMPWRFSWQISWSEVGVGSIVPASGIGGLALGAWVLTKAGMPAERIASRSVAFVLIKGSINFILVAVFGACMALGLFGPDLSLWLTAFPAALATLTITAVIVVARRGRVREPSRSTSRTRRAIAQARNALVAGAGDAIRILRSRNWMPIAGSIGYYAWDNAVLWATFQAFDASVPLSVIVLGYLIGQLGGLLPLPGGIGGIDGGLIGTLIVFGAPAAVTASAVLAYRVVLFWIPLIGGAIAFNALRRNLADLDSEALCRAAVGVDESKLPRVSLDR